MALKLARLSSAEKEQLVRTSCYHHQNENHHHHHHHVPHVPPPDDADTTSNTPSPCRPEVPFRDLSHPFLLRNRTYQQQYMDVYYLRYHALKPYVVQEAVRLCPDLKKCPTLDSLKEIVTGKQCVAIGTVYKDMALKPAVLSQYMEDTESQMSCLDTDRTCYVSPSDCLYIEDMTARVALTGENLDVGQLVTGLVIGVKGVQREGKAFEAQSVILPGVTSVPRPPTNSFSQQRLYLAVVSGLHIGDSQVDALPLQMLTDFLCGITGNEEMRKLSASIVRLVIAGEALTATQSSCAALSEADSFFAQLAGHLPVDLMPGEGDPSGFSLPQNPFPPLLFPEAKHFANFRSVPNPYAFEINGVRILGCSGQAVKDVSRFTTITNELEALRLTARGRCLAPTAPDTLSSYPFQTTDPFSLGDTSFPHIFFSGNHSVCSHERLSVCSPPPPPPRLSSAAQPKAEKGTETLKSGETVKSESEEGPLIVTVPSFRQTGEIVLVDLTLLSVRTVRMSADNTACISSV